MDYNFTHIEEKWRNYWRSNKTYQVAIDNTKPKFYVLDMFPYPSGAGLHVGHPLGYIASDIYARYKRLKGFNVLHPMGYDAYGLPAEQYAIQTGTHPAETTMKNIDRYRNQLDKIGFSFDPDRELCTCDPMYYKWTQWTFVQLFNSYYCNQAQQARPISELVDVFTKQGTKDLDLAQTKELSFTAETWNAMSEKEQQETLMNYRLAYLDEAMVNWCAELGSVLANDEISDGLSVRGGHPVERKSMRQWFLRITAYADRLLSGLDNLEWNDSIKDVQRNWIGKSIGASLFFDIEGNNEKIEVFTTRPDTIFGATFMVLAPEHELICQITTEEHKADMQAYVTYTKNRSERERMTEVKRVSGQFTGAYAINPFNGKRIPIWVADYVLMGYGTGAIMAVPAHDSRDFAFARHFKLPIIQVVSKPEESITDPSTWTESYDSKEGILIHSESINGLSVRQASEKIIAEAEKKGIGKGKINFRLRDAIFSRQRYWGEPFPIYYKNGIPYAMNENELPLELPEIDAYLPTETGEPPLARAKNWKTKEGYPIETSTMPGFAGSSAYYLRYMDPNNKEQFFSKESIDYWRQVDLYIGGSEHATGHLIYARFWNMFLFDLGLIPESEPFRKMINQGMIQGRSSFVYRVNPEKLAEYFIWNHIKDKKLGVEFVQNFRDGKRKFDFFAPEIKLLVEVKRVQSLEKVASSYEEYAKEKGYKILLIPIRQVFEKTDVILQKIKDIIAGKEIEAFEDSDPLKEISFYVSKNYPGREFYADPIHVDVNLVQNDVLDIDAFRKWMPHFANAVLLLEDGKYICGWEVEKMSKSKFNVQNPDDLVERYGADTLRMYEMFLGPLEQSKPWDTQGIEGVFRFIRKLWRLFHNNENEFVVSDEPATEKELKALHKTIKKIDDDTSRFSFNTAISAFMICVNELNDLKCNKRAVLEPLLILIAPYAPFVAEELWSQLGYAESITKQDFPKLDERYLSEKSFVYPVSFNGKKRFELELPVGLKTAEIEQIVLDAPETAKWVEGKTIKKVIIVPNKIINIVV